MVSMEKPRGCGFSYSSFLSVEVDMSDVVMVTGCGEPRHKQHLDPQSKGRVRIRLWQEPLKEAGHRRRLRRHRPLRPWLCGRRHSRPRRAARRARVQGIVGRMLPQKSFYPVALRQNEKYLAKKRARGLPFAEIKSIKGLSAALSGSCPRGCRVQASFPKKLGAQGLPAAVNLVMESASRGEMFHSTFNRGSYYGRISKRPEHCC